MPIPKNYPLESYDPRFKQLLLRGARGEDFQIECGTASKAYRLQHMLNAYRHKAKAVYGDDQPDEWRPLFTACVGLVKDKAGRKTVVHIYSRHNEFGDLLDNIVATPFEERLTHDPLDDLDLEEPKGHTE